MQSLGKTCLLGIVLLFSHAVGLAQESEITLLPESSLKLARLAPAIQTASSIFKVSGATSVKLLVTAQNDSLGITILCPNGQTLNAANISMFGGTYETYTIQPEAPWSMPIPELSTGTHYNFEFPAQGAGIYTVQFQAPAGLTGDLAVVSEIYTDSPIKSKLLTTDQRTKLGKHAVITAVLFADQSPVNGATVVAHVQRPTDIVDVTLNDAGQGADDAANDGLYTGYLLTTQVGPHGVVADISGTLPNGAEYALQSFTEFQVDPVPARLMGTVSDYGVDTNSDGLFENITVEAPTEVFNAGTYGLIVRLRTIAGAVMTAGSEVELVAGATFTKAEFAAADVRELGENGPYFIEAVQLIKYSQEAGASIVDELFDVGQTEPYLLSQLQRKNILFVGPVTYTPVDSNGNGKYEFLNVQIGVDVLQAGDYQYMGDLFDVNRDLVAQFNRTGGLVSGLNTVSLVYTGKDIIRHGPGPYKVEGLAVWGNGTSAIYSNITESAPYEVSQFEDLDFEFTGQNNAQGIDANANGKYELLRIQAGLYSAHNGTFTVQASLKNSSGVVVTQINTNHTLNRGINDLVLDFDGAPIANAGINGPLTVANLSINGNGYSFSRSELFTTQSFNSNQFEIGLAFTGQNNSAQGIDANANGKFESLRVGTELHVLLPGNYRVQVSLIGVGGTIQHIDRNQILNAGINQLQFDFSGTFIRNANIDGPLTVGNASVTGLGRSLQTPVLFTTQPFNSNQFEAVFEFAGGYSATGIDTNSDGKFNLLRLQGTMNVLIAGSYAVVVSLRDMNGNVITSSGLYFNFTSGINTFSLDLRGNDILRSGISGPYRVSAQAWDNPAQVTVLGVDNLFETGPFEYTDFERTFGFTGTNGAAGIDTNGNGLFETLRISSAILIERLGSYTVSASLKDSTGNVIQSKTINSSLPVGTSTLNFDFEGIVINNSGIDGPYTVGNISVTGPDALSLPNLFATQGFTTDQFESGVVDLHFSSYRFVPITGDGDAFLEPGETAEMYIKLSNHDRGQARTSSSTLTTASASVEVITNGSFGNIPPGSDKESTAFVVRLKPEAAYSTTIPFTLDIGYNTSQTTTKTFSAQTGKLNKILYNQNVQNRSQIFSMNSDGSDKTNLSNNSFRDYEPVSAPDGSKIAFQRSGELWVMNSDGTGQQWLTDLHDFQWVDPTWSPDSTKIAFLTEINGVVDLFVIGANGSGLVRLTNTPGHESYVSWSSTNKIAYTTDWGLDIHVVNPDGSGDTLIHDNSATYLYVYDLSWSPDGAWLGWINQRHVTEPSSHYYTEVYIARPDGSEKRSLTTNAEAQRFVWSPDSARIAYVDNMNFNGPDKIIVVDITTGQATNLSSFVDTGIYQFRVDIGAGDPKWSRDGKSIAFVGRETVSYPSFLSTYSVFRIDTDSGEINKLAPGNSAAAYKPEWDNLDRIPPASVISMTPPANSNGWNIGDVTLGIAATDNLRGTGVQGITYSATGAQTINATTISGSSTLLNVFGEGITSIAFSARDNANNIEDTRNYDVKIDKSLPISRHTLSATPEQTTVTLTATDAVSGVSELVYSVDGGASQNYSEPFSVTNTGGHYVSYFSRDLAGNEETQRTIYINPGEMPKSVLISEFRTRGHLGADDEFIELYNNGDTAVDISGWTLVVKHGSNATPLTLATVNSGTTIPARGHFLFRKAGTDNYSLSSYAEADQTYTDSLGDNCGIKLVSDSSVAIDAVGFASVTDPTHREGIGIAPSAGISTNGQYSFARNYSKNLPIDSNNNKADFVFVSTNAATYNNLKSILGSPGPENLNSPIYKEGDVLITQIDSKVTLAESPNRLFDYNNPPPAYPVGVLSVRRRLTNNSETTISQFRLRITAITTKNSGVIFPQQAVLRLFNSADISVTSADGQTTIPLKGLTIQSVPTTVDGGLNSSLMLSLGSNGLAVGESLNIDLKSGIATNGQYKLEFRIETVP